MMQFDRLSPSYEELLRDPIRDRFAGNEPGFFHRRKADLIRRFFRRCGLTPVFFARNVIGARLPALTYMLTFPDMAAREKAWATFRADPAWQKLRATPGYTDADVVSNISDVLLRPAGHSQI